MKYCSQCGNEVNDDAVICPRCGCFVESGESRESFQNKRGNTTLQTVAKVFSILAIVGVILAGLYMAFATSIIDSDFMRDIISEAEIEDMGEYMTAEEIMNIMKGLFTTLTVIIFMKLLWAVPMTVYYFVATAKGKRVGMAFKVCHLIFVDLIAGILMLCDNKQ